MSKPQYNFTPGDKLFAKDMPGIDPDNPVAQSPAKLIGGTDVVLQNFIDLGDGDNDGAFKATIDGVEYDDVSVDLSTIADDNIQQLTTATTDNVQNNSTYLGQLFKVNEATYLDKIELLLYRVSTPGTFYGKLWEIIEGEPAKIIAEIAKNESVLGTSTAGAYIPFNFNTQLEKGKTYLISINAPNSSSADRVHWHRTGTQFLYPDGDIFKSTDGLLSWSKVVGQDYCFKIYLKTSENDVARLAQEAIRSRTNKKETVLWNTDHFEILGGGRLKTFGGELQAPTTGTDISGAGYLDLGENATEVAGDGDDYKIVRTDDDNLSPKEIIPEIPTDKLVNLQASVESYKAIPSENIRFSHDENADGELDMTPVKLKEIEYKDSNGFITVVASGYHNDTSTSAYGRLQIYKNGVPMGGPVSANNQANFKTDTKTFFVKTGDLIQVYGWLNDVRGLYMTVYNMRLLYDKEVRENPSIINL